MIDRIGQSVGSGTCELCNKKPATSRVKFQAAYVQSSAAGIFEDEEMTNVTLEKRVCEGCLSSLRKAKNVTSLIFERL